MALGIILCQPNLRAEQKFEVLEVGANTYSNVTIVNKGATHVFVTHSKGMASFGVNELAPEMRIELGYEPPPPKPRSFGSLEDIAGDPELQALQQQWTEEINAALTKADPRVLAAIGAGLFLSYLFFCYCCLLICRKAGYEPGIWVWIPVIQMIPLFKAAKMSGWNFLLVWLPIVGLIVSIVWCFKICQARQKSAWIGLFLLLPISNLLAFLYLAFADRLESQKSSVIKLQYS